MNFFSTQFFSLLENHKEKMPPCKDCLWEICLCTERAELLLENKIPEKFVYSEAYEEALNVVKSENKKCREHRKDIRKVERQIRRRKFANFILGYNHDEAIPSNWINFIGISESNIKAKK